MKKLKAWVSMLWGYIRRVWQHMWLWGRACLKVIRHVLKIIRGNIELDGDMASNGVLFLTLFLLLFVVKPLDSSFTSTVAICGFDMPVVIPHGGILCISKILSFAISIAFVFAVFLKCVANKLKNFFGLVYWLVFGIAWLLSLSIGIQHVTAKYASCVYLFGLVWLGIIGIFIIMFIRKRVKRI